MFLTAFEIEITSSFGPLQGKIWRVGTMGFSCQKENILMALAALEAVLIYFGVSVQRGESI